MNKPKATPRINRDLGDRVYMFVASGWSSQGGDLKHCKACDFIWQAPVGNTLRGYFVDVASATSETNAVCVELKGEWKVGKQKEFVPASIRILLGRLKINNESWHRRNVRKHDWLKKLLARVPKGSHSTFDRVLEMFAVSNDLTLFASPTELLYMAIHAMWDNWESRHLKMEMRPDELSTMGFIKNTKGAFSTQAKRAGLPIGALGIAPKRSKRQKS